MTPVNYNTIMEHSSDQYVAKARKKVAKAMYLLAQEKCEHEYRQLCHTLRQQYLKEEISLVYAIELAAKQHDNNIKHLCLLQIDLRLKDIIPYEHDPILYLFTGLITIFVDEAKLKGIKMDILEILSSVNEVTFPYHKALNYVEQCLAHKEREQEQTIAA